MSKEKFITEELKVPDGFEYNGIVQTGSRFYVSFKKIKPKWPESWEELGEIDGRYLTAAGGICATKEQAEAVKAWCQLTQLRAIYRDGWVPDGCDAPRRFDIAFERGKLEAFTSFIVERFLSFETEEQRDHFLKHHRNLIMQARPMLGGF
jgi:hypothetical protein